MLAPVKTAGTVATNPGFQGINPVRTNRAALDAAASTFNGSANFNNVGQSTRNQKGIHDSSRYPQTRGTSPEKMYNTFQMMTEQNSVFTENVPHSFADRSVRFKSLGISNKEKRINLANVPCSKTHFKLR